MGFAVIRASDGAWGPTNPLGVANTNLTAALGCQGLTMRLWRVASGQAMPRHRHRHQTEVYLLLEGVGRMRIGEDVITVDPLSAIRVDPEDVRQVFNDTGADALWLIAGTPPEAFPLTPDDHADELAVLYPSGMALPPELGGSAS
jgi:quercetin dioxygenase-like cupin family protein